MLTLAVSFALARKIAAVVFTGPLGAAFATGASLQLRLMKATGGAGQTLASSLNTAAFITDRAWSVTWVGALIPAAALLTALFSRRLESRAAIAS